MNSLFYNRIKRASMPPIPFAYFGGNEFPETMSPEKIQAYQAESLREIIQRAYNGSPFYRKKFDAAGITPQEVREPGQLHRLPFTEKDELRGRPWEMIACDREDVALIQVSTGTTGGEEIYILYTWEDCYLNDLAPGYPSLVPVARGDICLNALPYEMSSAGLSFHKTFLEGCHATVVPAGKGGAYSTPAKTVKMMNDLRPTVVITTPSWSMQIVEAAKSANVDLTKLPIRKMWLTGEGCSFAFRKRVEKLWGVGVEFYYGSLECGCIGIECAAHNGYHITSAHVAVEIVDPETGKNLEPGEIGEIVVTCLLRYDAPLIRFRTEDLGYIDPDPCECGINLPRLFLRGRRVDQITVGEISLSPFYLEEFLMRQPEVGNWYQFVTRREGADFLTVRCEPAEGVIPSGELAEKLASKMEFATGIPFKFEFVDSLPRPSGKTIRVVRE